MALRALRDGAVDISEGLQGGTALGDEGLHPERMGRDDPVIGGEGCGCLDGLETLGDDIGIAHMMRMEEGFKDGTARALHRLEGPGQAVSDPHFVTDHTATVLDELCEGAHGGALRPEGLQRVAMGEPQFELEGGVRRVVCGPAGREGVALPRQHQGMDWEEDQKVILAQGRDQRPFVEFETNGHRWSTIAGEGGVRPVSLKRRIVPTGEPCNTETVPHGCVSSEGWRVQ
jgi:hypothetical protein